MTPAARPQCRLTLSVIHRLIDRAPNRSKGRKGNGVTSGIGLWSSGRSGIFSRAEALDAGESDRTLAAACRAGLIIRLRRGMYVAAEIYNALDDFGKHLLLARAVLAMQQGPVALAGPSAAALHGFALYGQDLRTVHILRLDHGSSRRRSLANHHVVFHDIDDELGTYSGLMAISPARAVWEVACRSSFDSGVVTADSALHKWPELIEPITEMQHRFAYFPGSRQGRITVRFADGRAESPGESITRVLCHRFGIPKPALQHPVLDSTGRLVGVSDFCWEDHRHLGEFDGKIKYERLLRQGESPADSVFREKRREDDMRAGGYGMSRFTWPDLMPGNARQSMANLAHALEQSRRLYARRHVTAS
jgi:Transcriptional regulator, AbiEi antitoxin